MLLRDLVLNHFWLKLFSVVLAALIWLAVGANISREGMPPAKVSHADAVRKFPQCPVLLMTAATDRRPMKVEPSRVAVTVRGPSVAVRQLQDSDIHVYVQSGTARGPGSPVPVEVHAPHGIMVIHVSPHTVAIKLSD